jgi:hypothetical protein
VADTTPGNHMSDMPPKGPRLRGLKLSIMFIRVIDRVDTPGLIRPAIVPQETGTTATVSGRDRGRPLTIIESQ